MFLCGAVVMVLEMVGSRILAPYLGTSIIVWTSLIGVILGCLSIGYWCGGRLADRRPDRRTFSAIILAASVFIAMVAFSQTYALEWLQAHIHSIDIAAPLATFLLFGIPGILLGMVTPYAVRLKMNDVEHSGATVGNLYAISTVGSIVGTFLAGYYLIALFGSVRILTVLAVVLVMTSIIAALKTDRTVKAVIAALILASSAAVDTQAAGRDRTSFMDVDTRYSRIWIYETVHPATLKPILALVTSPGEIQSARLLDGSNELALTYPKYYRLARHFNPDIKHALLIGGAGYSYAQDYLNKYSSSTLDVVEIDPGMTALAKRYFGLSDDPRLRIAHEDGRTYINRSTARYDAIYCDAFTSLYTIPFQLTTREAVQRMHNLLNPNGVLLVNIISAIDGEKGRFLRAEYATYKSVFPRVLLFPIRNAEDGDSPQNIMLVALKNPGAMPLLRSSDRELDRYLSHIWRYEVAEDLPVLTDDHAPVDNYIMKMLGRL